MSAPHQVAAPRGRWSGLGQLLRGKLFRDSGTYLVGSAIPRVLGVLLLPVWTHFLSPAEFGIISTTMAAAAFAGTFFGFGMLSMIPRFYFDFEPGSAEFRRFFTSNVTVFLVLALVICAVTLLVGQGGWASVTSGSIPFVPYVLLALAIYLTGAVWRSVVAVMRAERRSGEVVGLEMGVHLTAIAVGLYLVAFQEGGAAGKLTGEVVAGCAGAALAAVLLVRRYGVLQFSWSDVAKGFAFGLPFVPYLAAHWGLSLSGRFIITKYSTVDAAGLFGLAGFVGMTITMTQQSMNGAWSPKYMQLMRDDVGRAGPGEARAYFGVWVFLSGLACVGASVFARELVTFLADPRYFEAWKLVLPIALGAFVNGLCFPANNQLVYFKRKRAIPTITVFAALVQISAGVVLVQRFGAFGVAVSLVFAYAVLAVLAHSAARRDHRTGYPAFRTAAGIALVVAASLGGQIETGSLATDLGLKSAVFIVFATACGLVLVWPYRHMLGRDGRSG